MVGIRYCSEGKAVSDFALEEWFAEILPLALDEQWHALGVCTAMPIHRVRVAIREGDIPPEYVQFWYGDRILQPDKDGRMLTWPRGFCDTMERMLERLL